MRFRPGPSCSPRRSFPPARPAGLAGPVPGSLLAVLLLSLPAGSQTTARLSVNPGPSLGNDNSGYYVGLGISADDRYVAFGSVASNLVSGDTNGSWDVFVKNLATGPRQRRFCGRAGELGQHLPVAVGRRAPLASDMTGDCKPPPDSEGERSGQETAETHERPPGPVLRWRTSSPDSLLPTRRSRAVRAFVSLGEPSSLAAASCLSRRVDARPTQRGSVTVRAAQ